MNKALFLTLDNTLVLTKSRQMYPLHSEDWTFILPTLEAVRDYYNKGFHIIVLCNKVLINDKLFYRRTNDIMNRLSSYLLDKGERVTHEYALKEDSFNWLPSPGMVYELATEFKLNLKRSVLIGSTYSDKDIVESSGIGYYINASDLT